MSTDIINPVVTLIPAKHKASSLSNLGISVTRVAAYCRVSTDEEEQLNSYATQVKHYTIKNTVRFSYLPEIIYKCVKCIHVYVFFF